MLLHYDAMTQLRNNNAAKNASIEQRAKSSHEMVRDGRSRLISDCR